MSTIKAHPGKKGVKAYAPAGPRGFGIEKGEYDAATGEITFVLENGQKLDPVPLRAPLPEAPTLAVGGDNYEPTLTIRRAGSPREQTHKIYRADDGGAYQEIAEVSVEDSDVEYQDTSIPSTAESVEYVATTLDGSQESDYSNAVQVRPFSDETLAYVDRVEADGGEVMDIHWADTMIATLKNEGIYSDVTFLGDMNMGVKRDGSGNLPTVYDPGPTQNDAEQADAAKRPAHATSADFGGRSVAAFDGIDDEMLTGGAANAQTLITVVKFSGSSNAGIAVGFHGVHNTYAWFRETDGRAWIGNDDAGDNLARDNVGVPLDEPRVLSLALGAGTVYREDSLDKILFDSSQNDNADVSPFTGRRLYLGRRHNSGGPQFLSGQMALTLAIDARLSESALDTIEAAIRSYYSTRKLTPSLTAWEGARRMQLLVEAAPSGINRREPGNVLYDPDDTADFRYKVFVSRKDDSTGDVVVEMFHGSSLEEKLTPYSGNPIIPSYAEDPYVVVDPDTGDYWLYCEDNSENSLVGRYSSSDRGRTWTRDGDVNLTDAASPTVWREDDGTWHMLYEQYPTAPNDIRHATSSNGLSDWQDNPLNPMWSASDAAWVTSNDVVPDEVIRKDGKYYIFYHAAGGFYDGGMVVATDVSDPSTYSDYPEHVSYALMMYHHPETGAFEGLMPPAPTNNMTVYKGTLVEIT